MSEVQEKKPKVSKKVVKDPAQPTAEALLAKIPVPQPRDLIDTSLKIIQVEISKLSTVSAAGQLDPQQARILTEYVKTLVVVDKNAKDIPEDQDDVASMSDEELLEEAKKAIEASKNKKVETK